MLTLRSQCNDAYTNLKNTQVNLDASYDQRNRLQKEFERLQIESSKIKSLNETLERNLYSKSELLKNVEEQQTFQLNRLKEEKENMKNEINTRIHEQAMQYEDLRSYNLIRHDYTLHLLKTIEERDGTIEDLKEEKVTLEENIQSLETQLDEIKIELRDLQFLHDNLEEKNSKLKNNLENAETKIEELLEAKKALIEENRQIPLLKDEIVNMMN